jgi:hypothetical protein
MKEIFKKISPEILLASILILAKLSVDAFDSISWWWILLPIYGPPVIVAIYCVIIWIFFNKKP